MPRDPDSPQLIFTLRAWLKWQFLCHAGPTEIGAFGLSNERTPHVVEDLLGDKQLTNYLACIFAPAEMPDSATQSVRLSIQLSLGVVKMEDWKLPGDLLAAAYAETGDFERAVKYQTAAFYRSGL